MAVFVFAQPDSAPAQQLRARRSYFDVRTGDTWDVFFPGYFQYGSTSDPGEVIFDDYWGFSPRAFDDFRRDLEARTNGRWRYSGGSDLVVINIAVSRRGALTFDYESVFSGPLTDPADPTVSLTLAQVVERISNDIETSTEDPHYGVDRILSPLGQLLEQAVAERGKVLREAAASVAGEAIGAVGARWLGLK